MSPEGVWPNVKMSKVCREKQKKCCRFISEMRHKYVDVSWLNLRSDFLNHHSPELLNSDQVSLNSRLTSLINFSGSCYWLEKQRLNGLLPHIWPDRMQIWAEEPWLVEMNFNIHHWGFQKASTSPYIKCKIEISASCGVFTSASTRFPRRKA